MPHGSAESSNSSENSDLNDNVNTTSDLKDSLDNNQLKSNEQQKEEKSSVYSTRKFENRCHQWGFMPRQNSRSSNSENNVTARRIGIC